MESTLIQILKNLQIDFKQYEHKAVFTCDECHDVDVWEDIHVKSLLVTDDKKTKLYMVVLPEYFRLNTNHFAKYLGHKKLSFVSAEVMQAAIGVTPGSVSPFALLYDKERNIPLYLEFSLKGKRLGFHPLRNTSTITTHLDDLERFFHHEHISFMYYNFQ
jgi:Ala-tRNA(Pro) deacylase